MNYDDLVLKYHQIQELQRDAMRLDWLEKQYTLHKEAEIWYVVDGYQINLTEDDGRTCAASFSGTTLRQAIDEAMK